MGKFITYVGLDVHKNSIAVQLCTYNFPVSFEFAPMISDGTGSIIVIMLTA